jgi:hypothetical protein
VSQSDLPSGFRVAVFHGWRVPDATLASWP